MRALTITFLLLLLSAGATSQAQKSNNKSKGVVIPSEIYMPTIVAQPDCPLKIEKAFVGKMLDGTERMFFQARNVGSKAIVSFQINALVSNGNGVSAFFPYKRSQKSVSPGEVAPPGMNEDSVEFVSLTDDLRETLHLSGKMRAIVFFMVLKVELEDGSKYDATPLSDRVDEHLRLVEDKYDGALSKPDYE